MEHTYEQVLELIRILFKKGIRRFVKEEKDDTMEWNSPYTFYSESYGKLIDTEVSLVFDKNDEDYYFYVNDNEYDSETAYMIVKEIVNEEIRKLK